MEKSIKVKSRKKGEIIEMRPRRDEQGSDKIQYLKDLQTLLRLRQYNDNLTEVVNKLDSKIQDKEIFIDKQEEMIYMQQISCDIDIMKVLMRQRGVEFTELRREQRLLQVDNSLQHVFGIIRIGLPTPESINQPSHALIRESQPLLNTRLEQLFHIENDSIQLRCQTLNQHSQ